MFKFIKSFFEKRRAIKCSKNQHEYYREEITDKECWSLTDIYKRCYHCKHKEWIGYKFNYD